MHWNQKKGKNSLAQSYMFRVFGTLAVIVRLLLYQPMILIMLFSTQCNKTLITDAIEELGYECYDGTHIGVLVVCILAVVLFTVLNVLLIIFFSDENPDSQLPWAYYDRTIEMYKLFRKLVVSVALYIGTNLTIVGIIVLAITCLMNVISIWILFKQLYMNSRSVLYVALATEEVITVFAFLSLAYYLTDIDWTSPVPAGLLLLIAVVGVVLGNRNRANAMLLRESLSVIKNELKVEIYCRTFLERLCNCKRCSKDMMEALIFVHSKECRAENCPCRNEAKLEFEDKAEESKAEINKNGNIRKSSFSKGNVLKNFASKQAFHYNEGNGNLKMKESFNKIIINDLVGWTKKVRTSPRIHIYLGYLKLNCMRNKLASFYEIMCAEQFELNFYKRFLVYQLTQRVEDQLQRYENQDQSSIEINSLMQFQQIFAEMQESMQAILNDFIKFWKEVQDESPNFQHLCDISHNISQSANKIRLQYQALIRINPTNLYCRMLYALFLKKVMKDEFEALDVYTETNSTSCNIRIQANRFDDSKFNNNRMSLFVITCTKDEIGEVLCVNNEVTELLGYERSEIVGQNISKLMPPAIGEKHSEIVLEYISSGTTLKEIEKMALALHKHGYIVPCIYLQRIVPNLKQKLEIVGFLYKIKQFTNYWKHDVSAEDVSLILTDKDWFIQGFNLKAASFFGIDPEQANLRKYVFGDEKLSAFKLIPQLENTEIALGDSENIAIDIMSAKKLLNDIIETTKVPNNLDEEIFASKLNNDSYLEIKQSPVFKASLKNIELIYGKYDPNKKEVLQLKLLAFLVDQPTMKNVSLCQMDSTSNLLLNIKEKKKFDVLIDDVGSQSQSSTSSDNSTKHEQKNIRNFKQTIKEQRSPFFTRCFTKIGILIFLLILATASIFSL